MYISLLKRAFLFALFALFGLCATAQSNTYLYTNIEGYQAFLAQTALENTSGLNKKLQKQYSKIIEEKNSALIKQLNEKGFLFDTQAYPYLNSILNNILEKNSLDKSRYHFFIDRSAEVNAYSYEDGTVICDLGLLGIIENEDQLAMVFCHELGHCLLQHCNKAIVAQLEKLNSPEFLARVKAIKKQRYGVNTQLEGLLMADVFDRRRHSRSQERAADSLGMILFRNTGYSGKNVARLFDLLDSAENKTTARTIKEFFDREKMDLDTGWFKPVKQMRFGGNEKKGTADSLKTHPDCASRKAIMLASFNDNPKPGAEFVTGNISRLSAIKRIALFDEAAYSKEKDNYGFYLYRLIENDAIFPSDNNIKTAIFETLVSLCKYQRSHILYTVVNSPYATDDDKDEYAKLLQLLDRISLDKLIRITYIYYNNNKALITAPKQTINDYNTLNN